MLEHYKRRPNKYLNPLQNLQNESEILSCKGTCRDLTFLEENYHEEVLNFIERRLKYKYRRKLLNPETGLMKRLPYRLKSNFLNCGV